VGECWCYRCDQKVPPDPDNPFSGLRMRMNLCPDCGNKRCPKATDHNLPCGNSNKPGQKGSIYE